jgi:tetratricopeptide (TPR) repeat protein
METLLPGQLVEEGRAAYQKGAYISAAEFYRAAAEGFLAGGDERKAAEMANNSSVAYLKGGDARASLQAAQGTEQVFSALGDMKQQAMAIGNQAAALEKLKRYDEAMTAYERSANMLKEAGESELRAYVLQSISSLYLRKRHYLEAYAAMREGILGIQKPNFKQRFLKTLIQLPYNFFR